MCSDIKPACRRARVSLLMPSKRCVDEAVDCFSQSQRIFRSQFQPTFEVRWWVNVQRIVSLWRQDRDHHPGKLSSDLHSPTDVPRSQSTATWLIHRQTSESEMMWEVWSNEDLGNQVRTTELLELSPVATFFHVNTQRARKM